MSTLSESIWSGSNVTRNVEDTLIVPIIKTHNEFQEAYAFEVYDIPTAVGLFRRFRPVLYAIMGLYLAGIYFGQKWMKNRPAYNLRYPLFLWNLALGIFSIVATIRAGPQILYLLSQPDPTYRVVCTLDVFNYATAFWGLVFVFSKVVELGDTAFIILRKQKLIFLHWYHHLTVLVVAWGGYEFLDTIAQYWVLNTFVHSFMYSYYALRALKIRLPKSIAMFVTMVQISQFLVGIYWNIPSFYWMAKGVPCTRDASFATLILLVGLSHLALFINFFVRAYILGTKNKTD